MSLRDFRGTAVFLLFGLLQGCAGGKQAVPASTAQQVQSTQPLSEDKIRQNSVDEIARLDLLTARDLTQQTRYGDADSALKSSQKNPLIDSTSKQGSTPTKDQASAGSGGVTLSAVPLTSRDPEVLTNIGIAAYQRGDLAAAERSLRAALAIDPKYTRAMRHLALTLSQLGRREESAHWFAAAISPAQTSPYAATDQARKDTPIPPTPPTPRPSDPAGPGLPLRCEPAEAMLPPASVEKERDTALPFPLPKTDQPVPPTPTSSPKPLAVFDLPKSRLVEPMHDLTAPRTEPNVAHVDETPPPPTPPPPPAPPAVIEAKTEPVSEPPPLTPPGVGAKPEPVPLPPISPSSAVAESALDDVREVIAARPLVQPTPHRTLAKLNPPEPEPEPPAANPPPVVTMAPPVVEPEKKPVVEPTPVVAASLRLVATEPTPVAPVPPVLPSPAASQVASPPVAVAPLAPPPSPPVMAAPVAPTIPESPSVVPAAPVPLPALPSPPVSAPVTPPAPVSQTPIVPVPSAAAEPILPTAPPVVHSVVPAPLPAVAVGPELPLLPPEPKTAATPIPPAVEPAPVIQTSTNPSRRVAPVPLERVELEVLHPVPPPAPVRVPPAPVVRVVITEVKAE